LRTSLIRCLTFLVLANGMCVGQATAPSQASSLNGAIAATRSELTALLGDFVKETSASGLSCAIEPPKLIVQDVPSFGSYDPDTNTLTSPAWQQMGSEEQSLFYRGVGPGAKEADARAEFELGVHHWVFVHELGHWWEACRGMIDRGDHYGFELEADKIAAAYWNEHDPSIISHQQAVFQAIVQNWPNPLPVGQTPDAYFNKNYDTLGPTPAYIWFQAQMCLTAFAQKPLPRFSAALAQVTRN
jgi:hypothetical protein